MKRLHHLSSALPAGSTLAALERHSFSDEAACVIAERHSGVTVQNLCTIQEVQQAVGRGAHGLIPIENSSGGLVVPHVDWLAEQAAAIVLDIRHQIRMCAGGLPGGSMEDVQRFFSHAKGFDQCGRLLSRYPDAKCIPFDSTASAAKAVAVSRDAQNVVLASQSAIEGVGLVVYQPDVANHSGARNITQFYVVRKNGEEVLPDPQAIFHAAILTPEDQRGVLAEILGRIRDACVNLTSLHSRPIGMKAYNFFIEMERQGKPQEFRRLAGELQQDDRIRSIKWLGSWNDRFEV